MANEHRLHIFKIAEKIKGDLLTEPECIHLRRSLDTLGAHAPWTDEIDRAIAGALGMEEQVVKRISIGVRQAYGL